MTALNTLLGPEKRPYFIVEVWQIGEKRIERIVGDSVDGFSAANKQRQETIEGFASLTDFITAYLIPENGSAGTISINPDPNKNSSIVAPNCTN